MLCLLRSADTETRRSQAFLPERCGGPAWTESTGVERRQENKALPHRRGRRGTESLSPRGHTAAQQGRHRAASPALWARLGLVLQDTVAAGSPRPSLSCTHPPAHTPTRRDGKWLTYQRPCPAAGPPALPPRRLAGGLAVAVRRACIFLSFPSLARLLADRSWFLLASHRRRVPGRAVPANCVSPAARSP